MQEISKLKEIVAQFVGDSEEIDASATVDLIALFQSSAPETPLDLRLRIPSGDTLSPEFFRRALSRISAVYRLAIDSGIPGKQLSARAEFAPVSEPQVWIALQQEAP